LHQIIETGRNLFLQGGILLLCFGILMVKLDKTMNTEILDVIACPVCKGHLIYDPKKSELICRFDKLAYPIHDGVPIMIFEQSRLLSE